MKHEIIRTVLDVKDIGIWIESPDLRGLLLIAHTVEEQITKPIQAIKDLKKAAKGEDVEVFYAGSSDQYSYFVVVPNLQVKLDRIKEILGLALETQEAHARHNLRGVISQASYEAHDCHLDDVSMRTLNRVAKQLADVEEVLKETDEQGKPYTPTNQ